MLKSSHANKAKHRGAQHAIKRGRLKGREHTNLYYYNTTEAN